MKILSSDWLTHADLSDLNDANQLARNIVRPKSTHLAEPLMTSISLFLLLLVARIAVSAILPCFWLTSFKCNHG